MASTSLQEETIYEAFRPMRRELWGSPLIWITGSFAVSSQKTIGVLPCRILTGLFIFETFLRSVESLTADFQLLLGGLLVRLGCSEPRPRQGGLDNRHNRSLCSDWKIGVSLQKCSYSSLRSSVGVLVGSLHLQSRSEIYLNSVES